MGRGRFKKRGHLSSAPPFDVCFVKAVFLMTPRKQCRHKRNYFLRRRFKRTDPRGNPCRLISAVFHMEDLDFPEIKRKKLQERKADDKKEFKDLFESDSDSGDESLGLKVKGGQPREGEDDSDLDSLSDLSDEDDDEEGEDELERSSDDDDDDEEVKGKTKSKTKAREPAKLSKSDLKELADGDEDLVEDLELSDDD